MSLIDAAARILVAANGREGSVYFKGVEDAYFGVAKFIEEHPEMSREELVRRLRDRSAEVSGHVERVA